MSDHNLSNILYIYYLNILIYAYILFCHKRVTVHVGLVICYNMLHLYFMTRRLLLYQDLLFYLNVGFVIIIALTQRALTRSIFSRQADITEVALEW
jgi:hypothetical protein